MKIECQRCKEVIIKDIAYQQYSNFPIDLTPEDIIDGLKNES